MTAPSKITHGIRYISLNGFVVSSVRKTSDNAPTKTIAPIISNGIKRALSLF